MWLTNSSHLGRANGVTTPSYRARTARPREQQHTARAMATAAGSATATMQGSATTTTAAGGSATATADPVVGRAAAVDPAMGRTAAADSATGRSGGGMRGGGRGAAANPAMGTVAVCEEELAGEERRWRARRRSRGGGGSGDGAAADSAMGRSCGGLQRGARRGGAAAACEEEVEGRRRIRRWEGAAAAFPLALARRRLILLLFLQRWGGMWRQIWRSVDGDCKRRPSLPSLIPSTKQKIRIVPSYKPNMLPLRISPRAAAARVLVAGELLHLVSKMQPPVAKKVAARVDTMEIKSQIAKKLGAERSEHYFHSLKKFLGGQLGKEEFDKICVATMGRDNIKYHNFLIRSILSNAYLATAPPPPPPPSRQATTGNSQTSTVSVSNGAVANHGVMAGVMRGPALATREARFERPSPLGKSPLGHQGTGEFVSAGSKAPLEVVSVEDGEEVNQARGQSSAQNSRPSIPHPSLICYKNGELPEAQRLLKLLENKLQAEGLSLTQECADVLNSGLNAYLSRLLKSCMGVAKSRGKRVMMNYPNVTTVAVINGVQYQRSTGSADYSYQASLLDLETAVVCNPQLLGGNSSRSVIPLIKNGVDHKSSSASSRLAFSPGQRRIAEIFRWQSCPNDM
ncbi:hypothetical protein OsJ_36655 [Oryza sativa Japonica Group]|uniref:Uncharacterized protein n=1 Tax=Oryza sativa subsp. japonica TaxID=39947 RepID=B9GDY8_ORYSJ|nr:hypothetical protein OsJ_36655 [Oryza sativa Japonica Group]